MSSKRENSYFILARLCVGFFVNLWQSLVMIVKTLLGKSPGNLQKGKFIRTVHFVVYQGPRNFWKKPTGIKIGRSLSTLIHVIFFPNESKK